MRSLLAISLLLTTAIAGPVMAQERPAGLAGTGVAASTRANTAERPILFSAAIPAGAALIIPVTAPLDLAKAGLSAEEAAAVGAAARAAAFEPGDGNVVKLYDVAGRPLVLLVGVKPGGAAPTANEVTDAGGTGIQALRDLAQPIAVLAGGLPAGRAADVALGVSLGQYRYDRLKSDVKAPPVQPVTIVSADAAAEGRRFAADQLHVAAGVRFARDLVTQPANELYPQSFVAAVERELRGLPNVRITVLDEAQMRALHMGSLLSVGVGSSRPSRLLAVEYRGGGNGAPLALVGKGITFDSGGLSLKPTAGMWEMKGDMSGAAATMGAMIAAARRGAKVNLVSVAALSENMPDGNAGRNGDVVRTMNGQTIEIWSTDAEGRLVLADANQWTIQQYKPAALVNIATLTGAVVSALASDYAGLFARDEALAARVTAAGAAGNEPLWRLPIHPAYKGRMASEIADIKNASGGPMPGAGLAAHFISFLTPQPTAWAHIDMAGVDRTDSALPTIPKGPRGFGVRLFDQLVRGFEQQ